MADRRVVAWAEVPGVQPPLLPSERALVFFSRNPALDVPLPRHLAQLGGKVDGTWTAVSAERNGKPADDLKGNRISRTASSGTRARSAETA